MSITDRRLVATGGAIGTEPVPYRLDYQLTTRDRFVTARLVVRVQGQGWQRGLDLTRNADGTWAYGVDDDGFPSLPRPGGDLFQTIGAIDCDLGLSPLTNTMPVLRYSLHEGGGPVEFLMVWISVPDLAIHAARQRYTFVRREPGRRIVRFESLDDPFQAEIAFDEDGLVLDYPGIARVVER